MTPETAKTCTAVVNGKEVTGFQSILDAKQSAGTKDTSPLDFRIVGCVTADDVDHFSSSAEGIQLKGKSAYTEMNITIWFSCKKQWKCGIQKFCSNGIYG